MALEKSLKVALKEWDTVCQALQSGRQIALLRKGGIYEDAGEFQVENRQFLLFPTYVHQSLRMLKPEAQGGFEPFSNEPQQIKITSAGEVTDIIRVESRAQMDALDDQHIWTSPLIDMRFNYRPENPLYLLLVRAYQLPAAVKVVNTPAYAGCKSWVPLDSDIDVSKATAALSDDTYETRRRTIRSRLG